jgi:hypothetical protein
LDCGVIGDVLVGRNVNSATTPLAEITNWTMLAEVPIANFVSADVPIKAVIARSTSG